MSATASETEFLPSTTESPMFERCTTMVSGIHSLRPRKAHERLSSGQLTTLVQAASAGDGRAWEGLVDEFNGMVWAIARAHRLHDADAADVAQSTWLRLLENLHTVQDPARVGAWLATTARRESLRVLRHGNRQVLFGDDAPDHASPDLPPCEELLLTERDGALWRGFASLRATDRSLLRLLMTDPRPSYEEISAALDMPIGSIGPTRQRALGRLRQELDRQGALSLMTN